MAEYVLKKIPELDPAVSIADTDLLVIESSTGTKNISFANLKSSIPNYGYLSSIFTNLALAGNILTINHGKNTRKIRLTIFSPAGISNPYPWYIVDANNVAINFGGSIEAGDWEYLLEFWTGEGTGSYPDPIYEPAITKASIFIDYSSINSQINLLSFNIRRYNDIVIGHIGINFNNTYVINSLKLVGELTSFPPISDIFISGATASTNIYEPAFMSISSHGDIGVKSGSKNIDHYFNFTYFSDLL